MRTNEDQTEIKKGSIDIQVGDNFEVKLDGKMMTGYIKINGQEIQDVTKLSFSYDWNEGGLLRANVEFVIR